MGEKIHNIRVNLKERSYEINVESGIINDANKYLKSFISKRKVLIITDSTVYELYAEKLMSIISNIAGDVNVSVFPAGEEHKTLHTVEYLYHQALEVGIDRKSVIVALGGGVTGDVAGFTAATYMRGIPFIQVPTTLLAMVDSSVGGKTGVDLPEGKNLVGAFWQPVAVLIDPDFLSSLPECELRCGLAEVIKTAMISDAQFFGILESEASRLNTLDIDFYAEIIAKCCHQKAYVVSKDEKESNLRAILNYGHTFGHAIEKISDFKIAHGEAVAAGMCMAADLAVTMNLINKTTNKRQEELIKRVNLPTKLKGLNPEDVFNAMRKDKKAVSGSLRFILPDAIGHVSIYDNIPEHFIKQAIRGRCE